METTIVCRNPLDDLLRMIREYPEKKREDKEANKSFGWILSYDIFRIIAEFAGYVGLIRLSHVCRLFNTAVSNVTKPMHLASDVMQICINKKSISWLPWNSSLLQRCVNEDSIEWMAKSMKFKQKSTQGGNVVVVVVDVVVVVTLNTQVLLIT